jgi:hypothetical protein
VPSRHAYLTPHRLSNGPRGRSTQWASCHWTTPRDLHPYRPGFGHTVSSGATLHALVGASSTRSKPTRERTQIGVNRQEENYDGKARP